MKTLVEAVGAFLKASRDEWGSPAAQKAMKKLQQLAPSASRKDLDGAARLVSESLAEWPNPEAGQIALALGMLVELGAGPQAHVEALLARVRPTVEETLEFVRAMRESMPEPEDEDEDESDDDDEDDEEDDESEDDEDDEDDVLEAVYVAVAARLPDAANAARAFPSSALATIALLARVPEGRALARGTPALLEQARLLANEAEPPPNAKFLSTMLHVLDGESLLVLHPESKRGFDVTISGVADNFQLHTLLGAALTARGLPGQAPAPAVVACARGEGPQALEETAHGVFNLHHWFALGPDGSIDGSIAPGSNEAWIWNEGVPADVCAFGGRRIVVLGPPPYPRSWSATRLFNDMPARVEVTRELDRAEVEARCLELGRAPRPTGPRVMHGGP